MQKSVKLVQGNLAIAAGAFYAGATFFAGYPITPSSEIAEECSRRMPQLGGVYMQMEDEIASIAAVVGASLGGAKSFTATSGPGFSLMQENLGMAVMAEVPCVVVNVQRSGPSTGLATKPAQSDIMQIRWGRHGDQAIIALSPATVQECFELTVQAFNLAERFRVPVILAADEVVAHMRENLYLPETGEIEVVERKKPTVEPVEYKPFQPETDGIASLASFGGDYVMHVTSSMHGPDGISNNNPTNAAWRVDQLHSKLERYRGEIVLTKAFNTDGELDVLIIAFGVTTRAARAAAELARKRGIKAGVLQLVTLWPFPDVEIEKLANRAKSVVVVEMNYSGQVAGEVERFLQSRDKLKRVNKYNGEIIMPADIMAVLE